MDLVEVLNIKKGSTISIIGAGGKTTFMFTLAEELKKKYKVLVTTTTKIYLPENNQYDYLETGTHGLLNLKGRYGKGIYVYGNSINEEGKLTGIDTVNLEQLAPFFDYILVEADGSKQKSIKGWNNSEPVICNGTTSTVGILSIDNIDMDINEHNVHRVKEFLHIIHGKENDKITIENLVEVVFNPKGLFKNALGEKVLFINKVDDYKQLQNAYELLHCIEEENKKNLYIDKIILGSLKDKKYGTPITCKGMI